MKKSIKIISILMMIAIILMASTSVFAADKLDAGTVLQKVDITTPTESDTSGVMDIVNKVLGYLQWAAIIATVIIVTILGIKYMMGSLEEKAAYKKSMIPLIVGCLVAIGATTITKFLFGIF